MKGKKNPIFLVVFCLTFASFVLSSPQEPRPFRILLSNDDGIQSPGLEALFNKLSRVASVEVVAPSRNHSGVGHALTFDMPFVVTPLEKKGATWYAADVTPVTCVRLGLELLLKEKPDLVVSGINRGDNLGVMTFSSGTVGCAREACIKGIPAIAVSLVKEGDREKEKIYLEEAADFIVDLVQEMREKGWKPGRYLNVNYPSLPRESIKGVRMTRQDTRAYPDYSYRPYPIEGKIYIWYDFTTIEGGPEDSDTWNLRNGYIIITPLLLDQTDPAALEELKTWKVAGRRRPSP